MSCRTGILLCDKSSKSMGGFRFPPFLAAARSRLGSDGLPDRHSLPRRHSASLHYPSARIDGNFCNLSLFRDDVGIRPYFIRWLVQIKSLPCLKGGGPPNGGGGIQVRAEP